MDEDVAKIKKQLDNLGLEYKTQFSNARFVLRFIISKSKSNISKLSEPKPISGKHSIYKKALQIIEGAKEPKNSY